MYTIVLGDDEMSQRLDFTTTVEKYVYACITLVIILENVYRNNRNIVLDLVEYIVLVQTLAAVF